jgi:hypothetical protein
MPHPFASRSTITPSFDGAEWDTLTHLPGRVLVAAMGATTLDGSAPVGTVADGLAGLEAIAAGRSSPSRLIQDVVGAIFSEQAPKVPDLAGPGTDSRPAVLRLFADARSSVRMLARRVSEQDANAYRDWLVTIAAAAGPHSAAQRFRVDLTLALTG